MATDQGRRFTSIAAGLVMAATMLGVGTPRAHATTVDTATTLWSQSFGSFSAYPYDIAMSPDGRTVFVTGDDGSNYGTVAYDASTGHQMWVSEYDYPGWSGYDFATSLAVSPDGHTVYVTGGSNAKRGYAYATIAYDASIGATLWVARYRGSGNDGGYARAIAVSPNRRAIFVTGQMNVGCCAPQMYVTVAYNATNGQRLWVETYHDEIGTGYNIAAAIAVSPDSQRVFVTGYDATIAYDADKGGRLWLDRSRFGGDASSGDSIAVSPDGNSVFIVGNGLQGGHGVVVAAALDAGSGDEYWTATYAGPGDQGASASSLAVSPNGRQVFAMGESAPEIGQGSAYTTLAFSAASGAQEWVSVRPGPAETHSATSHGLATNGKTVFAAGDTVGANGASDVTMSAYAARTGALRFEGRYDSPAHGDDYGIGIAIPPDRREVCVLGQSYDRRHDGPWFSTIAYRAPKVSS
jgi:WD40 repeat protein